MASSYNGCTYDSDQDPPKDDKDGGDRRCGQWYSDLKSYEDKKPHPVADDEKGDDNKKDKRK